MIHVCPSCKTSNEIHLKFKVEEYICSSCAQLIDISKNTAVKVVKKPISNVVLEVGQKGILEGKEYTVISIVVRKYGSSTLWREYVLKNALDENLYLSESYGHWVLLKEEHIEFNSQKKAVLYNGLLYRWFETTPSSIESATGYFEEKLSFTLATYVEYVFGTKMISYEHYGNRTEIFTGKHIPFKLIQKAFNTTLKPNKYGIGMVQPFYINTKQLLNIFGVTAIAISLLQLFNYTTKANYEVLNDVIRFDSINNKELVSKSFTLEGGSAPMNVKLFSNVDNSWANVELNLVNENTNEITYASKDIERYSGYEDGESWSEGSTNEEFNLCGVAPGKYHFIISAQKQGLENMDAETRTYSDGNRTITKESNGLINVKDNLTGNYTTYSDESSFKKDSTNLELLKKLTDSAKVSDKIIDYDTTNPTVEIKAFWKPISLWNFGISIITMAILIALAFWGRYLFEKSKWSDSSNTPYPESEE